MNVFILVVYLKYMLVQIVYNKIARPHLKGLKFQSL